MSKRAEILQLANSELQQKGVASLSFRELAAKLGIKSSSVHYYFPQKDDLVEAVMVEYHKATLAAVYEGTKDLEPGKPRLLALIDLIHKNLKNRQCTAGILSAESAQISKKARKEISSFFADLKAWISGELEAMGKKRDEAAVLSQVIVPALEGALMLGSVEGDDSYLVNLRKFVNAL